jgi:hypothetical protein
MPMNDDFVVTISSPCLVIQAHGDSALQFALTGAGRCPILTALPSLASPRETS